MEISNYEYENLKTENRILEDENSLLKVLVEQLETEDLKNKELIKYYEELVARANRRKYGASSEKTPIDGQLSLFDEAENTANETEEASEVCEICHEETDKETVHKGRKKVGKKEADLSKLPVEETIVYELPEDDRLCPSCGEDLHVMSKSVRKEVKIIPAKAVVIEHVSLIYSCRNCEKNSDDINASVPVIKAESPKYLLRNSIVSPSAAAYIMVQKYVNGMPLYRIEHDPLLKDLNLSRQTMANWIITIAMTFLLAFYNELKAVLLSEDIILGDETVVQVLKEPSKKPQQKSFMWVYRTGKYTETPIIIYEYKPNRSQENPKAFLKDFKGILHTDGYAAYHSLEDVTNVGCFAHMRRKFVDAVNIIPEEKREGSESQKGLNYINEIFKIENEFTKENPNFTLEELQEMRIEKIKPVAEAFFAWAENLKDIRKGLLKTAVTYAREQKKYLMNVFLDPRLEYTTNAVERSIRSFVIGRGNWIFCASVKGAEASSMIYSIVQTTKENGLDVFRYLEHILEVFPNAGDGFDMKEIMPWSDNIQNKFKI